MQTRTREIMDMMESLDDDTRIAKEIKDRVASLEVVPIEDADMRKNQLVGLTDDEAAYLKTLNRHDRRAWLAQQRKIRRLEAKLSSHER